MTNEQTFIVPWPPTLNTYYSVAHGRKIMSAAGRNYKIAIRNALGLIRPYPRFGDARLSVTMRLIPKTRAKTDIDNRCKAIFDNLKELGVFDDDSQIYHLEIFKEAPQKPGCVQITIRCINE